MRLDQFVANSTTLSRKDAKRAIAAGRVRINDKPCKQARQHISAHDSVQLDHQPVAIPEELYLMMHKPAGVISATTDSNQATALDLLPGELAAQVHIAGRLDKDTTGLLLLTSDGQWSHQITSPRRDCPKTYRVSLAEPLGESARKQLEEGVLLKGEDTPTKPASVVQHADTLLDLTIHEGRYHQVKRMLAAVGNRVTALHRQQIGPVTLDDDLAPGEFRFLTDDEVQALKG
ncbi:MAG: 16S rRNA pseudouridine synthase [Marinobacter sp. T13-3]|nr:MAG: 16S rRNA pseudouridine synthase [Marinobacter sp. T13-3]